MIDKSPLPLIEGLEEFVRQNHTIPPWVNNIRQEGYSRFQELGIPTVKDEEWKYTSLSALAKLRFKIPSQDKLKEMSELKKYINQKDANIVFINGFFSKELSNVTTRKLQGATISTFEEAFKENNKELMDLFRQFDNKGDSTFIALNKALTRQGVYIKVDKGAELKNLIHIVHITSSLSEEIINCARVIINLEKSSPASVLESHLSFNEDIVYLASPLTDIFLAENSFLKYCKAQKESAKSYHVGNTRVVQEQNATFEGFSLMTGGVLTRNNLDIILEGEGASAILNGLYCVNDTQLVDNHSAVDHRKPNCTSNQYYKGVLNGASKGVFNGKIFVREIAQKTNSYQLNKNLLLGKEALINTKPQLEIHADDVKCTHGATIGQLNEDEIFYLQTRSIGKQEAIRMLSKAFIDDILSTISEKAFLDKLNIILEPVFAQL